MTAPQPEEAVSLANLVADCTCPVCQQLFVQPLRLRCQHTFCLRCYDKMCRKLRGVASPPDMESWLSRQLAGRRQQDSSVQCPVCRETFDSNEPASEDVEVQLLLQTLQHIKAQLCQEPDCWQAPAVACPCCEVARCGEHHSRRVQELMASGRKLCDEVEAFVNLSGCEQQLDRLQQFRRQLDELQEQIEQRLSAKLQECRGGLQQAEVRLLEQQRQMQARRQELAADAQRLHDSMDRQDVRQVNSAVAEAQSRLQQAKRELPLLELAPAYADEEFLASLDGLLAKVRVDTLVRPYEGLGSELRPSKVKRTHKLQPWDLCLLTNVSGVFVDGQHLTLGRPKGCQQLQGPCLVVNYKGFVSKCLHVLDMDGSEVATICLEMRSGEMPGKFFICNERQLVFASDPGNHEVFVFDLGGGLLKRFGGRGSQDGKFDEPMSMFVDDGLLYVADSENKRVQLFDIANDYAHVASLRHRSFSNHVHSVIVSGRCVAVSDRERKQIFTFDKATRLPLVELSLDGQPFDMVGDAFGNVLVTLTKERKVVVLDSSVSRCLNSFSIHRGAGGAPVVKDFSDSSSSDEEPLLALAKKRKLSVIHGLAFAPDRGRLFLCDTFHKSILIFDL